MVLEDRLSSRLLSTSLQLTPSIERWIDRDKEILEHEIANPDKPKNSHSDRRSEAIGGGRNSQGMEPCWDYAVLLSARENLDEVTDRKPMV